MSNHVIAPSILAADFANLGDAITMIDKSEAEFVHIDVMDGRFVPNISFGIPVIKDIRPYTKKVFDVHLMIVEPEKYISDFYKAGANILTIHLETSPHLHRSIQAIKETGMKAGVALNPHSNVELLQDVITDIDLVCLMSVNPGFGGQKFIQNTLTKIRQLKTIIAARNSACLIEIDGGVTLENASSILAAGADILVAGSTVFKAIDPIETISKLKAIDINTFAA